MTLFCCPLFTAEENLFLIFEVISSGPSFQQVTITSCSSCTIDVSCKGLIESHISTTILIRTKDIETPSSKNIIEPDPSHLALDV